MRLNRSHWPIYSDKTCYKQSVNEYISFWLTLWVQGLLRQENLWLTGIWSVNFSSRPKQNTLRAEMKSFFMANSNIRVGLCFWTKRPDSIRDIRPCLYPVITVLHSCLLGCRLYYSMDIRDHCSQIQAPSWTNLGPFCCSLNFGVVPPTRIFIQDGVTPYTLIGFLTKGCKREEWKTCFRLPVSQLLYGLIGKPSCGIAHDFTQYAPLINCTNIYQEKYYV